MMTDMERAQACAEHTQACRMNIQLGRFTSGRFAMQPGAQGELVPSAVSAKLRCSPSGKSSAADPGCWTQARRGMQFETLPVSAFSKGSGIGLLGMMAAHAAPAIIEPIRAMFLSNPAEAGGCRSLAL